MADIVKISKRGMLMNKIMNHKYNDDDNHERNIAFLESLTLKELEAIANKVHGQPLTEVAKKEVTPIRVNDQKIKNANQVRINEEGCSHRRILQY